MPVPTTPNFDAGAAQSGVDQQKAALLAALAQGGSAMAQDQARTQATMAASSGQAAQMASARSATPEQAAGQSAAAGGQGAYYAQVAAQQAGAGNAAMGGIQAANSNYMDQARAAVPAIHAQTGRELQSMQHAAGQAQADRALRTQIAQMQLQETQARIAAAGRGDANDGRRLDLDGRRLDMEDRRLDLEEAGGGKTPQQLYAEDQANRGIESNRRADSLNQMVGGEGTNAGQALSAAVMGKDGRPVDSYAAALAQLNMMYETGTAKTPGGKPLDRNYMMGLLAQLYGVQAGGAGATPSTLGGGLVGRAGGVSGSSMPVGGLRRPGA